MAPEINDSIFISGHKCFAYGIHGFLKIRSLNIVIGKNNSGKSSLLEVLDFCIDPTYISLYKLGPRPLIQVSHPINSEDVNMVSPGVSSAPIGDHRDHVRSKLDTHLIYELKPDGSKRVIEHSLNEGFELYGHSLIRSIRLPFEGYKIFKVAAERNIVQEAESIEREVDSSGSGITNLIRIILNHRNEDSSLVEDLLLRELNAVTGPEIIFTRINVQQDENRFWEIFLTDSEDRFIPLSKMGSGIKTIIQVLVNIVLLPRLLGYSHENIIFVFEELENNLHPALQRKLYNYIGNMCEMSKAYTFITTHSNIVIDSLGKKEYAQILHVLPGEETSSVKVVNVFEDFRMVFRDLDFKPSDLLLSNGIVWVEGPSDVIYIKMFLKLYCEANGLKVKFDLDGVFKCLATAVWNYVSFEGEDAFWATIKEKQLEGLIGLSNLSTNHLVVIDKDNDFENLAPSDYEKVSSAAGRNKYRLLFESYNKNLTIEAGLTTLDGNWEGDKLLFWLTTNTIESYLKEFNEGVGVAFAKYFDVNSVGGYFEKKRDGRYHYKTKMNLAIEVATFVEENRIVFGDFKPEINGLGDKIRRLYNTISSWYD